MEVALELYNILSESDTNLRQPVGLENQLMKNSLGSEVGQSILQLLQVHNPPLSLCLQAHCALSTGHNCLLMLYEHMGLPEYHPLHKTYGVARQLQLRLHPSQHQNKLFCSHGSVNLVVPAAASVTL